MGVSASCFAGAAAVVRPTAAPLPVGSSRSKSDCFIENGLTLDLDATWKIMPTGRPVYTIWRPTHVRLLLQASTQARALGLGARGWGRPLHRACTDVSHAMTSRG